MTRNQPSDLTARLVGVSDTGLLRLVEGAGWWLIPARQMAAIHVTSRRPSRPSRPSRASWWHAGLAGRTAAPGSRRSAGPTIELRPSGQGRCSADLQRPSVFLLSHLVSAPTDVAEDPFLADVACLCNLIVLPGVACLCNLIVLAGVVQL